MIFGQRTKCSLHTWTDRLATAKERMDYASEQLKEAEASFAAAQLVETEP
jgi:hypothetical protein